MKKPLFFLSVLIITCILFTGCVQNSVKISLNNDEGGIITYSYQVNKTAADRYFKELPKNLEKAIIETKNGEQYYCETRMIECSDNIELKEKLLNLPLLNEPGLNLFSEVVIEKAYIKLVTNKNLFSENIQAMAGEDNIYEYIHLELEIKAPRTIHTFFGGTLSEDGQTLYVNITNLAEAQTIEADYSVIEEPFKLSATQIKYIAIISVIAVIASVAVTVICILRQKHKRAEAMPDIPVDKK